MPFTLAALGGSWIIVAVAVLMLVALAYNYYTVKGSGIDAHPSDGRGGSPGAAAPSDAAKGRATEGTDVDGSTGGTFSGHGTR